MSILYLGDVGPERVLDDGGIVVSRAGERCSGWSRVGGGGEEGRELRRLHKGDWQVQTRSLNTEIEEKYCENSELLHLILSRNFIEIFTSN